MARHTVYRLCSLPPSRAYLPRHWAYGEPWEPVLLDEATGEIELRDCREPGCQVWTSRKDARKALLGGSGVDGDYTDARTVIELEVRQLRDDGGCEWPTILPEDVIRARVCRARDWLRGERGRDWTPRWKETLPRP